MAKTRKVGNLMALAVLSTLFEGPMHRYEIAARLRERGKEGQMDIKWGSLYTVVQNLEKHGFVEVAGTEREGARPERIIYRITAAGHAEAIDWLRELVSIPEPEPHRFVAALSIVAMLPPDEVITLLDERVQRLTATLEQRRRALTEFGQLPQLFLVENHFELAMLEAELGWVRELRDQLRSGEFPDVDLWRQWHVQNRPPGMVTDLVERGHEPPTHT